MFTDPMGLDHWIGHDLYQGSLDLAKDASTLTFDSIALLSGRKDYWMDNAWLTWNGLDEFLMVDILVLDLYALGFCFYSGPIGCASAGAASGGLDAWAHLMTDEDYTAKNAITRILFGSIPAVGNVGSRYLTKLPFFEKLIVKLHQNGPGILCTIRCQE